MVKKILIGLGIIVGLVIFALIPERWLYIAVGVPTAVWLIRSF